MKKSLVVLALLAAGCSVKQEASAARQSLDEAPGSDPVAKNAPATPVATASAASMGDDREHGKKEAPRAMASTPYGGGIGGQFASPIRAGEWDDNANYREYQRYIGTTGQPIHAVDVRARRFLIVRDVAGKAVSRCPVTVSDDAQHSVTLTTTASGRAILFPYAEGLSGKKFTANARCVEGSASTTVALDDDGDGTAEMRLAGARRNDARVIDLAFILDTTGSMSEEIASVKSTIQTVAKTLQGGQFQVRIGMVEYKDRTDKFVTKNYAFTTDLQDFAKKISGIEAGGGGDMPEDMNQGVHAALTELEWSSQSVAKMAFVIADAPPHLDYPNDPDYALSMKTASHKGIQLFGVAASGMDALGQAVMRQMAQYTGATEMFVLRGGAGPQSTGGGDPLSSCGGTQEQYASGNLDGLIVSKIKRELASLDADPTKIAGLRTDESAKPCNERFALKY
jgi:hypothetical protein